MIKNAQEKRKRTDKQHEDFPEPDLVGKKGALKFYLLKLTSS
jgi:hypothetical protein